MSFDLSELEAGEVARVWCAYCASLGNAEAARWWYCVLFLLAHGSPRLKRLAARRARDMVAPAYKQGAPLAPR